MSRQARIVLAVVFVGVVMIAGVAFYMTVGRSDGPEVLSDEIIRDLDHNTRYAHGAEFWHVYKTSSGHGDSALHRHCLTHDVNGDGDTEDSEDNDGTCPGPDTDLPDLAWHPLLPNKDDSFWERIEGDVMERIEQEVAGQRSE